MAKMPGTIKFCTHVLHLENEVVFGSQKRKADMSIGDEQESHRLHQVTFIVLLVHELKLGPLKLELLVVL